MSIIDIFKNKKYKGIETRHINGWAREGLGIGVTEFRKPALKYKPAILCHGFMANQDSVRGYALELAAEGYAVYTFDFNGGSVMGSKSEGKTTDMSVLTEAKDLETVIENVLKLPYVEDELLVGGCSQGGFVSALVAGRNPELISKLLLIYPALCIPDDARKGQMMFAKFDPHNIPEVINCGPMKLGRVYAADVVDMDQFEAISGYNGDVMIIHGDEDDIVDVGYAYKAEATYKDNAEKLALHIIKGGKHGFTGKAEKKAKALIRNFARSS